MIFKCCLKSSYSLRTQLLLSFGLSAFVSFSVVVILACVAAYVAGRTVSSHAEQLMRGQVSRTLFVSSKLVAEKFNAYMVDLEGTVQLLVEGVQDRIVGYPEAGWEGDSNVPFFDMMDGLRSRYPLDIPPPPLDWNLTSFTDESTAQEHLQERYVNISMAYLKKATFASASYFFQGSCDPSVTDPSSDSFYPGCTEAHSNVTTGGVLRPTNENYALWLKAGDLQVFLKPLFESQVDALFVTIGFFNEGAGSLLIFPGRPMYGTAQPYESNGCDWMRNINPNTGQPFASEEVISRCHPAGTIVPQREYNPMEQPWCEMFALHDHMQWYGPYFSKSIDEPVMMVGKGVFDRMTGAFIGYVGVTIELATLSELLDASLLSNNSVLSLVRFDTGMVINDSLNSVIKMHNTSLQVADTNVIHESSFVAFQQAFNFTAAWTPEKVDAAYQTLAIECKMGLTTAYPLPMPPKKYDPDYMPVFFMLNIMGDEVFDVVNEIEASISSDVDDIGKIIVVLGLFGMVLVVLIVWCVSRMLTQPLMWMEATAYRIINHADDVIEPETPATMHCSPKSEVNELVTEFRCMIQNFSGPGASTVAESALQEIRNELTWHSDFQHLYSKRGSFRCNGGTDRLITSRPRSVGSKTQGTGELTDEESNGGSGQGSAPQATPQNVQPNSGTGPDASLSDQPRHGVLQQIPVSNKFEAKQTIVPAPIKQNRNHVINVSVMDANKATWAACVEGQSIQYHRSRLFWLIVVLIVIPLLVTNAVICSIVSTDIVTTIPSWVDDAGASSYALEERALSITATSKAALVKALLFETIRDLHLVNRVAGWLVFGAINRSDSFTNMDSASEECKYYSMDTCPFYFNASRVPCPCAWEDLNGKQCTNYSNEMTSRDLQRLFFAVQSLNADNVTGFRNASPSFPELGSLPNTTQWWRYVEDLPGSWKGSSASGFATSYDRARVSSAVSVAESTVYNYRTSLKWSPTMIAFYLAFQDDGLFMGFTGCAYTHGNYAFWNSTRANGAYKISPSLCPYGKYGYDPRCRGWYATGKSNYDSSLVPVHITAPYSFALQGSIATSATSPMGNPETGEYAGQVLLDFFQVAIRDALSHVDTGNLSILITPLADETSGDTVVGPNKTAGWESANITDLLFLHDQPGSPNRLYFERNALTPMKNGSSGTVKFQRTNEDLSEETLMMAYAPIQERVLLPLNPSDFSRGVNVSNVLLYSVGVGIDIDAMHEPFRAVELDINNELEALRYVYIAATIFVSLLFTAYSCLVTLYVTKPLITLLRAVKNINKRTIDDDFPPLMEGSREVHRVYSTFAKLCKVVRISNTAFFSNKLKSAYRTITNALALFRKVEDRKAVGIACNNLGNTLFAMYYYDKDVTLEEDHDGRCNCVACLALPHYGEAIEIAKQDFESSPDCLLKADYALQYADRLFSRGLFLLVVEGDACVPTDAREQAYRDIQLARNLDYDVRDYWLEHKALLMNSAAYFSRLIRRINGLAEFWDDVGLREVWDVKELINDADQLLFAAWNEPTAPIFDEVTRVGRLQQLESAAIQLWHRMGNDFEAARLAMRMLSEDEYLLEGPFVRAAEALLRVVRDDESSVLLSNKTVSSTRHDLRRMLKCCKNVSLDIGKNVVFTMELSERWEGDPLLEQINVNCMNLYDRHCMQNDYIGVVAYTTKESLTVELGSKEENVGRQRTLLDIATTSTTERANPAFPLAVQMVVDSQASLDNDSYIILCMDGYAWDSDAASSIQAQIERLNRERTTLVHVIVIGLDVEDDTAREQCRRLCTVSKSSMYADGSSENLESIFDVIVSTMSGKPASSGFQMGITMEKF